jgi:2,4-dienoyl-CoA reductase-like NADH-dependent reductase (Old Yellow Enzyme family)
VNARAFPRVASFKTPSALRAHLEREEIPLSLDDLLSPPAQSPLAEPLALEGVRVGNRFCILPMEGWDGEADGRPSALTERRWRNFGRSGAKLIWGGEAVAVRHDGRANPHQLLLTPPNTTAIARLRQILVAEHRERFGSNADADLFVGLQLTHSGRYARPDAHDRSTPLAATANPLLDRRAPQSVHVLTDRELEGIADDYVAAARLAWDAGFAFVDVKQCHGYLGHELLGAIHRPGPYGGSLEHRMRFLARVIDGIAAAVPRLRIGVRLSIFDTVPFRQSTDGVGIPETDTIAHAGFGVVDPARSDDDALEAALGETRSVLRMLESRDVRWICTTAGSPYYNPHVQRPAFFPPLDGYQPPEDPLRGVARQIRATAMLKRDFPELAFVGSAYSYLQDYLPHVAQHAVRNRLTDFVGLGRIVLSYPDLPADVLSGAPLRRESFCRTFSDCTTAPRMGLVSGCYPLDPFYAARAEAAQVRSIRVKVLS